MTTTQADTPQRAALYLRLSKADRLPTGELDTTTIDRHRKECHDWADRNGWTIVDEYTDNSVSATRDNVQRPGYTQLLAALDEGKHDGIVCWNLDRLTRRMSDRVDLRDRAVKLGVQVATHDYALDLTSVDGQVTFLINGVMAEAETRRKDERQRSFARQSLAAGEEPPGGRRPFGFRATKVEERGRRVTRYREHDEREAALIREAVERLIQQDGRGLRAIVREWGKAGVTTPLGRAWRTTNLRAMLLSPRNAGLLVHDGEVVGPARWAPIITTEQHEQLRAALAVRSSNSRGPTPHLLTGVLRCGQCGAPLRMASGLYYACIRTDDAGAALSATQHVSIGREAADAAVLDAVVDYIASGAATGPQTEVDRAALDDLRRERAALLDDEREVMARSLRAGQRAALLEEIAAGLARVEEQVDRIHRGATMSAVLAKVLPADRGALLDALRAPLDSREGVRAALDDLTEDERRDVVASLVLPVVEPKNRGRNIPARERIHVHARADGTELLPWSRHWEAGRSDLKQ